jgi:hypothetical protein
VNDVVGGETHPLGTGVGGSTERAPAIQAAAALSFTAALIHASVAPAHFTEYWGFGLFFVVVAALQLIWAGMAGFGYAERRFLVLGAIGNLAVALVWLASRTVGIPIGPGAGQAEGLGLHDAVASLDELAIAALVDSVLLSTKGRGARSWLLDAAWALAGISFVGAFLGGHGA